MIYKKYRNEERQYPLPLRMRHGTKALDTLDDFYYLYLITDYYSYLIYRVLRNKVGATGKDFIELSRKINAKRLYFITKHNLLWVGSDEEADLLIVAWEAPWCVDKSIWPRELKTERHVGPDHLYREDAEYEELEVTNKYKAIVQEYMGPVEAECIKVEGAHSCVPWMRGSYTTLWGEADILVVCQLCGREYCEKVFYPKDWWPKLEKDYKNYICSNRYVSHDNHFAVCGGPCAQLVESLGTIKFAKRKYRDFIFLAVYLGVIEHADCNKNVRRAAEDFVRYARPIFERKYRYNQGQDDSQAIGQYYQIGSSGSGTQEAHHGIAR